VPVSAYQFDKLLIANTFQKKKKIKHFIYNPTVIK